MAELQRLGYNQTFGFAFSLSQEDNLVGWTGNHTELTVTEVIRRITVMKDTEDCPTLTATFKVAGQRSLSFMTARLTRALYPHGRCCRYSLAPEDRLNPPYELELRDKKKTGRKYQMIGRVSSITTGYPRRVTRRETPSSAALTMTAVLRSGCSLPGTGGQLVLGDY